jgi:TolB-like protein/Tfp pilus assembly protein PilF
MAAILRDSPPRIEVSPWLDRIVSRCLAKSEPDRFPSAAAAAAALRRFPRRSASKKAPRVDSIAVLPFISVGGDADADYLCDGITESLINNLSEIPRLRVVPRSTVFRYKGMQIDGERATGELNARFLLTGRIRQRNDALNIQAELVDAAAGAQLWGERYNRKLTDISAVEENIARQIVNALRLKLSGAEKKRLVHRATHADAAYPLYLKGRYLWNKRTREALELAIQYFKQAIDQDPTYALAYAGMADCYAVLGSFAFRAPQEAFPHAQAAARHAIGIDGNIAEAHVSLAVVSMFFDVDRNIAQLEFKQALALNPNYAVAHQWYGMHLCFAGEFQQGLVELREAQRLEPLSPMINVQLGVGFYLARSYEEAVRTLRHTIEFEPAFWPAHYFLGTVHAQLGDDSRAVGELEMAVELSGRHPMTLSGLGRIHGRAGRLSQAGVLLDEIRRRSATEYVSPYHLALVALALGDEDQAFEQLRACVLEHSPYVPWLAVDPIFDSLSTDARFNALKAV